MPCKILVIGELNVDILLNNMPQMPELGKEILAEKMQTVLGSSSAIFAANIASLGAKVSFCGAVGNDQAGRFVLDELQQRNIDTRSVKIFDHVSTGATIILNYGQDRANVTYCGAMELLSIDDIPWDRLDQYQHVHISNFFIQKEIRKDITKIFKELKMRGLTTSLDPQWDVLEKWDFDFKTCLPFIDVFLPNESELKALTGKDDVNEAIEAIRPHINILALKMGTAGSLGIKGDEQQMVPAFKAEVFEDAIGAGDSFNAGFIMKFLEGAPLDECLEYGNIMGSVNTTQTGGTAAFSDHANLLQTIQALKAQKISI